MDNEGDDQQFWQQVQCEERQRYEEEEQQRRAEELAHRRRWNAWWAQWAKQYEPNKENSNAEH